MSSSEDVRVLQWQDIDNIAIELAAMLLESAK
jgi:hypothetical protein